MDCDNGVCEIRRSASDKVVVGEKLPSWYFDLFNEEKFAVVFFYRGVW